jgi:hypothetical protein
MPRLTSPDTSRAAVDLSQLRIPSLTPSQTLRSLANPRASGISQGFELALSMAFLAVAEIRVAHLSRRHTLAGSEPVRIPVGSSVCGPACTRTELQRLEESDRRGAVLF